jgi:hypothetical protein
MEDVVLPGWVVFIIIPGIISWAVWVSMNTISNKSDIKLNETNDTNFRAEIRKDVADIKTGFRELTNTIINSLGKENELLKQHIGLK